MRVGFIGLGNMGGPMARNVVAAGFDVVGFDLDPHKVSTLVTAGGTGVSAAADAVVGADVVMTSLPGPVQIDRLAGEIIPAMTPGSVWAELSTNDLECCGVIGAAATDAGINIVDAPVSGGWEGAEAGSLTVLVGGTVEAFEQATPVLKAIGDKIEHLGPHGAGCVAKISQVMLCYLNSVCLTEALLLGVKGGVDPHKMLDIIQSSTGRSYVADRYGPEILNGGYDASFDLGLAAKDLRLGLDLARSTETTLPFTADVAKLYVDAVERFGFDAPHLVAMQLLEADNDLILHKHGETP